MKALFVGALFVLVALVTGLTAQTLLADPEHTKPPHARPADSGRTFGTPDPAMQVAVGEAVAIVEWVAGVNLAEWLEGVERERLAEEARIRAAESDARQRVAPNTTSPSRIATGCNIILPDHIVQRESGGDCNAYNATGCGGRGCLGYAQLDAGHFAEQSPWNPNATGSCYGISYDDCVARLWNGGAGAGHWR